MNFAKKNCEILNIPYYTINFKDVIGYTVDEISKKTGFTCTYCGVFRRYCLNIQAKKINISKIALGHNLDDTAQSILMNIAKSDVKKLARMAPHVNVQPGLIPRIAPLRTIPENEIYLYGKLNDIEFYDSMCPYAENAQRNIFREVIYMLENRIPGARHAILKTYEKIIKQIRDTYPPANLVSCDMCTEPTTKKICKTCELKEKLKML